MSNVEKYKEQAVVPIEISKEFLNPINGLKLFPSKIFKLFKK